jgi:hypothetical protein
MAIIIAFNGLSSLLKYFGFSGAAKIAFALGFFTALYLIIRAWILLARDVARRLKGKQKS